MTRKVLSGIGLGILGTVVAFYALLPWPVMLRLRNPSTTALVEHRIDEARRAGASLDVRRGWVPLDSVADVLVRAVVVAEDHRFREHGGIDWQAVAEEVRYRGEPPFSLLDAVDRRAFLEAVGYAVRNRAEIRGRSTLTQQLAKNLYYGPERSWLRKLKEAVVARRLERMLDKDRILELYLNVVELGPGIFGVAAASEAYFGRTPGALTAWQAATLAGTLPHPLTSNPERNPGRMAWRRDLILGRLGGRGPAGPLPRTPDELPVPEVSPPELLPVEDVGPVEEPADTAVPPEGPGPAPTDTAAVPPAAAVPPPPDTAPATAGRHAPNGMVVAPLPRPWDLSTPRRSG